MIAALRKKVIPVKVFPNGINRSGKTGQPDYTSSAQIPRHQIPNLRIPYRLTRLKLSGQSRNPVGEIAVKGRQTEFSVLDFSGFLRNNT
ncbi:MAG: hypothetical protein DWI02_08480 [Planctomycetota bacterium]|jgi:hypothetical protein|nr:MAG: hypothetical protein DWI02_08480 [Planctomycetota bacterium]